MSGLGAARRLSHGGAFALALIAPPIILGAVGYALYELSPVEFFAMVGLITALSPIAGGLSYLIVGAPLFWRAARRGMRSPGGFALIGLLADVIATPLSAAVGWALFYVSDAGPDASQGAWIGVMIHAVGLIYAPIYGLLFGLVYRRHAPPPEPDSGLSTERTLAVFR